MPHTIGSENLLTEEEIFQLEKAIAAAEKQTSGEIRVHIDKDTDLIIEDRAVEVFELLHMHQTQQRNGVLIYMSLRERQFMVLGDVGINEKVKPDFWDDVVENMAIYFKNNEFAKGLIEGVFSTGSKLKEYFPIKPDDNNELSNKISFGNTK